MLDDMALLRFFVATVAHGSLSAAARAQDTTLPVASRKLTQLERALGVRLLHRTTRRQSLTEEGALLHAHAVRLLAELDDVGHQLMRTRGVVTGLLRIAAPAAFGRRYLAPLLGRFSALHPELQVELELGDRMLDLVAAGIDLAVRFGGLDDSSYVSRPLAPNHRVLCAAPAYARRHGLPESLAELSHHDCLGIGVPAPTEWRFAQTVVRIVPKLASNDGEAVHQWALHGHGIALKSIWDVADDLQAGRLVRVLPHLPSQDAPLHAVYPNRNHLALRVRTCIDFLVEQLGGQAAQLAGADARVAALPARRRSARATNA